MKVLLIDNYDSFTYMLKDYVEQSGYECFVFRNDDPILLELNPETFMALVISPGPGKPEDANLLMKCLDKYISILPVLGICLGHQSIGVYYGAKLLKANKPRHGKVDEHVHHKNKIFKGVPVKFLATRYHSLIISDLPNDLEPICFSNAEIMGLVHKDFPVWGLQFHPESCETPEGLRMIKNFLAMAKKIAQI